MTLDERYVLALTCGPMATIYFYWSSIYKIKTDRLCKITCIKFNSSELLPEMRFIRLCRLTEARRCEQVH